LLSPDHAVLPFLEALADAAAKYPSGTTETWPVPEGWPAIEAHFSLHLGDRVEQYMATRRSLDTASPGKPWPEFRRYADAVQLRQRPDLPGFASSGADTRLRYAHWLILDGLDDAKYCPGHFKLLPNTVQGNRSEARARPECVVGTIRAFHESMLPRVGAPEVRAVLIYMMILKSHCFNDGNGRVARYLLNTELVESGLPPIVIPDLLREEWIKSQRVIYRKPDPGPLLKQYRRACEFTRNFLTQLPEARL
jgi:hypothetical protein